VSSGSNPEGGREIGRDPLRDEFDAIVALWKSEGRVPQWPGAEPETSPYPVVQAEPATAPVPLTPTEPLHLSGSAEDTAEIAAAEDDDHYIPPEPPPLPRIGPPAIVGAVLLGIGLLLVITPAWLGMSDVYGLPLGLIALAAGLGWLVLRLWPDSVSAMDRDDDPDGGAVL
jgi:hypothetical protein